MRFSLLIMFTVLQLLLNAQAPALIPYQAVARDASGQALNNATINARFTIHDGAATDVVVWQELQTLTTTALGLFTAQLGSSVPLTGVNWANGNKFIQVEIDLGQGFVDIGTQQMLSVPYALHAGSVSLDVSSTGDTLFVGNGEFVIVPGISEANSEDNNIESCDLNSLLNPNLVYGSMTDQEGNVYKTIIIGSQEWMAENLRTSIYRNGFAIPTDLSDALWQNTNSGAWTYYSEDTGYACPYGKLYNWYTCVDSRQLCPVGWHVPTDVEWSILINFLDPTASGGDNISNIAGGQMKTTSTVEALTGLWYAPNVGATNSSGFSGAPAGYRNVNGSFDTIGIYGFWWSSSENDETFAWNRSLINSRADANRFANEKRYGFSVRCLRD